MIILLTWPPGYSPGQPDGHRCALAVENKVPDLLRFPLANGDAVSVATNSRCAQEAEAVVSESLPAGRQVQC